MKFPTCSPVFEVCPSLFPGKLQLRSFISIHLLVRQRYVPIHPLSSLMIPDYLVSSTSMILDWKTFTGHSAQVFSARGTWVTANISMFSTLKLALAVAVPPPHYHSCTSIFPPSPHCHHCCSSPIPDLDISSPHLGSSKGSVVFVYQNKVCTVWQCHFSDVSPVSFSSSPSFLCDLEIQWLPAGEVILDGVDFRNSAHLCFKAVLCD